jgi:hypothetical protein
MDMIALARRNGSNDISPLHRLTIRDRENYVIEINLPVRPTYCHYVIKVPSDYLTWNRSTHLRARDSCPGRKAHPFHSQPWRR